jgi:hypothetical protein
MDVEGSDHGLFQITIPTFAWRYWGKAKESAVRVTGLQAGIRTVDLQIFNNPFPHPSEFIVH